MSGFFQKERIGTCISFGDFQLQSLNFAIFCIHLLWSCNLVLEVGHLYKKVMYKFECGYFVLSSLITASTNPWSGGFNFSYISLPFQYNPI